MKRIFYLICLMVFALISCNNNSENLQSEGTINITEVKTVLVSAAIAHNDCMEDVYNEFLVSKKTNLLINDSIINSALIKASVKLSKRFDSNTRLQIISGFNSGITSVKSRLKAKTSEVDTTWNKLYPECISDSISDIQKVYINRLDSTISSNLSYEEILSNIDKIEIDLSQHVKNIEQPLVLAFLVQTKYSLKYWYENKEKWANLIDKQQKVSATLIIKPTDPTVINEFSWRRVVKGDVCGAGAGVAAFGVGALCGGPVTWGAFGASVGGWAAGCSVYEGLMQIGYVVVNPNSRNNNSGTVVVVKK